MELPFVKDLTLGGIAICQRFDVGWNCHLSKVLFWVELSFVKDLTLGGIAICQRFDVGWNCHLSKI